MQPIASDYLRRAPPGVAGAQQNNKSVKKKQSFQVSI